MEDWVCIVVDDGSAVPVTLDGDAKRFRLLRQKNRGVAAARNAGAALTSSEFVAFLDQDDEWLPAKLERQIAFMRERELGMSDTRFEFLREDGLRSEGFDDHCGDLRRLLGTTARMGQSTVVFDRRAFDQAAGFDEGLRFVTDWDLQLRVAEAGWGFARLEESLALIHLHARNESANYKAMCHESLRVLRRYRNSRISDVRSAAAGGERYLRRHYATDALRMFRETRDPSHLATSVWLEPRVFGTAALARVSRVARGIA
jgi:glycosyltransferase involved in cell wall biosynthesis